MKIKLMSVLLLGATSFLQANPNKIENCSSQLIASDLNQKNGSKEGQSTSGTQISDKKLKKQIQDSLENYFSNKYNNVVVYARENYVSLQSYALNTYNNVIVRVNKGYVTLRGSVASKEDKEALEKSVRDTKGVRDVKNEVTVIPQNSEDESSNKKLSKQIQDSVQDYFSDRYDDVVVFVNKGYVTFQSYFSDKYSNVTVKVNDGVVTLEGNVATEEDKDALEQKIRKMDGVRDVKNNLTVEGA